RTATAVGLRGGVLLAGGGGGAAGRHHAVPADPLDELRHRLSGEALAKVAGEDAGGRCPRLDPEDAADTAPVDRVAPQPAAGVDLVAVDLVPLRVAHHDGVEPDVGGGVLRAAVRTAGDVHP